MRVFADDFWELRRSGRDPIAAGLTAARVAAYLEDSWRAAYPPVPAGEIVAALPREWWMPMLEAALAAALSPEARGARELVKAVAAREPALFASDPMALLVRRAVPSGFLRAQAATVVPALREALCGAQGVVAATALLRLGVAHEGEVQRALDGGGLDARALAMAVGSVGYEIEGGRLRRLFGGGVYELAFAPGTFDALPSRTVPAAAWREGERAHAMGGTVDGVDASGARVVLQHVLTLDPVPPDLGVSVARLVLAVDLGALTEEGTAHAYVHEADGRVRVLGRGGAAHPTIVEMRVQLARIEGAALDRTWGEGPGARCDRVGGVPFFVQEAAYPACPGCGRAMVHVLSIDSGLPLAAPGRFESATLEWGSGGVASAFWCDGCRTSAWTWACT